MLILPLDWSTKSLVIRRTAHTVCERDEQHTNRDAERRHTPDQGETSCSCPAKGASLLTTPIERADPVSPLCYHPVARVRVSVCECECECDEQVGSLSGDAKRVCKDVLQGFTALPPFFL